MSAAPLPALGQDRTLDFVAMASWSFRLYGLRALIEWEDYRQMALAKLWEADQRADSARDAAFRSGYLFRAVRALASNVRREARAAKRQGQMISLDAEDAPVLALHNCELECRLRAMDFADVFARTRLSERERCVVRLAISGCTDVEIGRHMGVSRQRAYEVRQGAIKKMQQAAAV